MDITFNYSSVFSDMIGSDTGLSTADIRSLTERFEMTRADLEKRSESGNLPFWNLPFDEDMIESVNRFATEKRERFRNFVLLGIGGSALGPIALHSALNHPQYNLLPACQRQGCRFFCPDNVDPDLVGGVLDVIEPEETLFNVVSKSGSTAETAAQMLIVMDMLKRDLGSKWRDHMVLTTDPEQGLLRKLAQDENIASFSIPSRVGGRFSVLTPVGLLPAAMTSIDIAGICSGARKVHRTVFNRSIGDNPAALLAGILYLAQTVKGLPIHVIFAYSNRLYYVADWFRQLWAESLGKRFNLQGDEVFTGPTPVKAVGATDQHSQVQLYIEGPRDKITLFLGAKRFDRKLNIPRAEGQPENNYLADADLGHLLNVERRATAYALTRAGRPNMTLVLDSIDAEHVGALLYLLEAATLYAGGFYGVNPLDQPGVEAGKIATYALMNRPGYENKRQEIESSNADAERKIFIG